MSRTKRNKQNKKQDAPTPTQNGSAPQEQKPVVESTQPEPRPNVKPHLRCPICWEGYGGRAERRKWQRQVSGPLQKRCYVCNQCGCEWTVDVRVEEEDGILYQTTKVAEVRENG